MSGSGPSRAEPPAPLVCPEPRGEARNTAVVARRLLPAWCPGGHVGTSSPFSVGRSAYEGAKKFVKNIPYGRGAMALHLP